MSMYKVELTEKEARDLGEKRWMDKNKWRYFSFILLCLVGAALIAFISAPKALNISDWVSLPIVIGLGGFAIFALWRGTRLCTKAGKTFIQSLKEGKQHG